jgi:hypothetical protein
VLRKSYEGDTLGVRLGHGGRGELLLVLRDAVRRSLWRGLREAPTSGPGSADARELAAEVARIAAVQKEATWAAQGSPWPGSRSLHRPVQLEQFHCPRRASRLT